MLIKPPFGPGSEIAAVQNLTPSKVVPLNMFGRPSDPTIIQMQVVSYDMFSGEGEWALYRFPDVLETSDWNKFYSTARKILYFLETIKFEGIMAYVSDYRLVNFNLISREYWCPIGSDTLNPLSRKNRDADIGQFDIPKNDVLTGPELPVVDEF